MLPNDTQRLAIIGKTGSGKTQAAAWHLSNRSFNTKPWIIYDFKIDKLLNEIEGIQEIDLSFVPKKPGLYIVHPLPDDQERVERHLWTIWEQERIGVYIDEGYMIGNSKAFRALLTQGRSKQIPMIVLSQRPSWISRFLFSEADYYQVFWLNDIRDRKIVKSFVPFDLDQRLKDYHSIYYDVGNDKVYEWQPVPNKDEILNIFDKRLINKRKII